MAPQKSGENTKKAAGNAKKAEAAAQKHAAEDSKRAKAEEEDWSKGAKSNAKKDAAADKAAEAARRKAEKDALLREEEASLPSKPARANAKTATKKSPGRPLDLSQLEPSAGTSAALNASGIDDALDALALATGGGGGAGDAVDRHPERRVKAAYAAFEERRLAEMVGEKGLRRQQKVDAIRREFERSAENPFNQGLVGRFDMSKEEMREMRAEQRGKVEERLVGS